MSAATIHEMIVSNVEPRTSGELTHDQRSGKLELSLVARRNRNGRLRGRPLAKGSAGSAVQLDGDLRHALALELRALELLRARLARAVGIRGRGHAIRRAAAYHVIA